MMLEVDTDELSVNEMVVVVPLITVTVVRMDVDEVPLFKMGPRDPDEEELRLLVVLVGVVKEKRDVVLLVVVVDRKTPVEALKEVVLVFVRDVLLIRQEAGIVKQHGKPLEVEVLGWNGPV